MALNDLLNLERSPVLNLAKNSGKYVAAAAVSLGVLIAPINAEGFMMGGDEYVLDDTEPWGMQGCPAWRHELFKHEVKKGENLWDIAGEHYGTITRKDENGKVWLHYPTLIAQENGIDVSGYLHPGQSLVIPGKYSGERYCDWDYPDNLFEK